MKQLHMADSTSSSSCGSYMATETKEPVVAPPANKIVLSPCRKRILTHGNHRHSEYLDNVTDDFANLWKTRGEIPQYLNFITSSKQLLFL